MPTEQLAASSREAPAFTQGATTLYAQFASVLRSRIMGGEFSYDEIIPSIEELCRTYSLGRVTVTRGLQLLAEDGLLTIQRGRGTSVKFRPPLQSGLDGQPMFQSVTAMSRETPRDYKVLIRSRTRGQALPASRWNIGRPHDPYQLFEKLDQEGARVYGLSSIYIPEEICDLFPKGADARFKLLRLVQKHSKVAVTGGRERFTVAAADHYEAETLGIPMASPVARAVRVFTDAEDQVIYYGNTTYRGDFFGIELDLKDHLGG